MLSYFLHASTIVHVSVGCVELTNRGYKTTPACVPIGHLLVVIGMSEYRITGYEN